MAKLSFRYSAMKSGKSAEIIQIYQNYQYQNIPGLLLVPEIDSASDGKIKSRFGEMEISALSFKRDANLAQIIYNYTKKDNIKYVIIDEGNFLTKQQVDQLANMVDDYNIDILIYGIMTNFKGELFEGSKRLVEIADKIENIYIRSRCSCGKTALFNARFVNGVFSFDGEELVIDKNKISKSSEITYVPLCRKCFEKYKNKK